MVDTQPIFLNGIDLLVYSLFSMQTTTVVVCSVMVADVFSMFFSSRFQVDMKDPHITEQFTKYPKERSLYVTCFPKFYVARKCSKTCRRIFNNCIFPRALYRQ